MTLRKGDDGGNWKRKHQIALRGELALEEVKDLYDVLCEHENVIVIKHNTIRVRKNVESRAFYMTLFIKQSSQNIIKYILKKIMEISVTVE
jgi:hypothetical protein